MARQAGAVSILQAVVRWLVVALSWLPDALRPGLFAVALLAVLWGLKAHPRRIFDWTCRTGALAVDWLVGLALLPDYAIAVSRRRRGGVPGRVSLGVGGVFERLLDGAATVYRRHLPADAGEPRAGPRFPWAVAALLIAVPLTGWVIADQAPDSGFADFVDRQWNYWRDLESWSDSGPAASTNDPTTTSTTATTAVPAQG